jgi:hypothetical protein
MIRRIVVAATLIATGVVIGVGPVDAATNGCSAQDTLVSVDEAIAAIDYRGRTPEQMAATAEQIRAADKNGDELLCVKKFDANNGQDNKRGLTGYQATMINDNRLGGNG